MKPGLVLLALGLLISLPLSFGTISVGSFNFNLYWMLLGVTLAVLGLQSFYFGCLAQVLCDYTDAARARWTRIFPYTRMVVRQHRALSAGLRACSESRRLLPDPYPALPQLAPRSTILG